MKIRMLGRLILSYLWLLLAAVGLATMVPVAVSIKVPLTQAYLTASLGRGFFGISALSGNPPHIDESLQFELASPDGALDPQFRSGRVFHGQWANVDNRSGSERSMLGFYVDQLDIRGTNLYPYRWKSVQLVTIS